MNLSDLSIKRPVFITCLVIVMLVLGAVMFKRMGVELFPDVSPPVVSVRTMYPGTGPKEMETLVTKPIEDSVSTIAGVKRITSQSFEGISQVVVEFFMDQDIKQAEQRIRDKVAEAKARFPKDVKEPLVSALDFGDQAIITIGLASDLPEGKAFDLADDRIKPKLQQIRDVGNVEVLGGRKREIHVVLDRQKLKERGFSAGMVASKLAQTGSNIPAGKINEGDEESVFRSKGEFKSLDEIGDTVLSLFGNDNATRIRNLGNVVDTLEEEKNRVYVDGKRALLIQVYKQSKTNTVAVAQRVREEIPKLEESLRSIDPSLKLTLIRDGSREINLNILDVKESIFLGILLTIVVVFLFLGNFRSTIITGLALPNSLIGSFILMYAFGLSINIVTLLALSLVVGLLIDDAIVVRENIFRYLEQGYDAETAAKKGAQEVTLAVIATTLVVISVFGPIALTSGLIGKILANFGLTICFAMMISLFDALTIAPMLSAYFAGKMREKESMPRWYQASIGAVVSGFDKFQGFLERIYEKAIYSILNRRLITLLGTLGVVFASFYLVKFISKTFIPAQDEGEFTVALELPTGNNLPAMDTIGRQVDEMIRVLPEVDTTSLTVGGRNGEANLSDVYVRLKPSHLRSRNMNQIKEDIREKLKPFSHANPQVRNYDFTGGGMLRPVTLRLLSNDDEVLPEFANKVFDQLKKDQRLKDVDTTLRQGKRELSFDLDSNKAQIYGLNTSILGQELRAQVQGVPATVFRQDGLEYDVRVLMDEKYRNLAKDYQQIFVMNFNNRLVRLADVTKIKEERAQASIDRQDRSRYIAVTADLAPKAGIGDIMKDLEKYFAEGDLKLPSGVTYALIGEGENFAELSESMTFVLILAVTFIYLVLSSLYESFVTPITIILTLPLSLCGAFIALFAAGESINLFSVLGMLLLIGVSCKNSILLVDFTNHLLAQGKELKDAIAEAGRTRLRPILMTSLALIAGTIPIAVGLNEASQQRVSMGIAIIGGVISSTLLSLIVVPALLPTFYRLAGFLNRVVRFVGGRS